MSISLVHVLPVGVSVVPASGYSLLLGHHLMHNLRNVGHALQVVVCGLGVHFDGAVRVVLCLRQGGGLVVVVEPVFGGHEVL